MTRRTGWLAALAALLLTVSLTGPGSTATGAPSPARKSDGVDGRRGTWEVRPAGEGRYVVAWTSPARLPLTSDRPTVVGPDDWEVGPPTVEADGRTVRAVVLAPTRPDPARLSVVLSGERLDSSDARRTRLGAASTAPLSLPGTVTLADDPGKAGPYAVATSDYTLPALTVPGLRTPVEMVGHVVEPAASAATGPRPLVLFLHGRHNVCYDPRRPDAWTPRWPCRAPFKEIPSQLGYDYLQRVLASQGYATVSIRANGINAQDGSLADGGADARARLVQAHLDHWVGLAAAHQVDLSRVVLVGHSRGGEGVDRASIRIPLSAPYRVVGQVLIAPTDFGGQTAPYVPTVTLLPFCDGDVTDLQGQRFTDTARDLAPDDTALKSSVLVMGANHNFFNTEWTPGVAVAPAVDDWSYAPRRECGSRDPLRLKPAGQRAVATAYVAGAVHLFAADDQGVLPLFDGSRARVASQGTAQTLSHAIGGGRSERAPGIGATAGPTSGGAQTRLCAGEADPSRAVSCARTLGEQMVTPHWTPVGEPSPSRLFLEMTWSAAGATGGLRLASPLDLTDRRLELRTLSDPRRSTSLQVRITDADGASAVLTPVGGAALPALGTGPDTRRLWAQTVVVDPHGAAVDLAHVTGVDVVGRSARGRLWIADVAAAPSTLAAVPATRLPTVDIGRLRVREGSGGVTKVGLPFTVNGTVTAPARLAVVTVGQEVGRLRHLTVDLAPGQTSGTIPIQYVADRRPDYSLRVTQVVAWPLRGAMTDRYTGDLTVVDDDPRPKVHVRAPSRVVEGHPVRIRVRLSSKADYDVPVVARVVRGPGRQLQVGDVDPDWVSLYIGSARPSTPLWRTRVSAYADVRPRHLRTTLVLPTVRDHVREGPEALTLVLVVDHRRFRRTVMVVDAR